MNKNDPNSILRIILKFYSHSPVLETHCSMKQNAFLNSNFPQFLRSFFLLSLYICILLYCRKAKLKVESISQYPCGNAKMGQR